MNKTVNHGCTIQSKVDFDIQNITDMCGMFLEAIENTKKYQIKLDQTRFNHVKCY
jgi:hypothetical protein